jgi:hypothetical protein
MTERHAGQAQARLRGVDDAGLAGESEVSAQDTVGSAPGQRSEEFLRLGHA